MQSVVTDEQKTILKSAGTDSILDDLKQALKAEIGRDKYEIWFENSTRINLTEDNLVIRVANPFLSNWIENHYSPAIMQIARRITGKSLDVTFAIDPELSGRQRRPELESQASQAAENVTEPGKTESRKTSRRKTQPRPDRLKLSLETFVVGPSNQLAYNAAMSVANEDRSPFNPLFFHGGYGVGKTHLLQGICNAVCQSRPGANWLYMSAEDFTNQYVLALKCRKLEAFRRRLRQTDVLAIDDIHFLANKKNMQEEFLHTFNTIDLAGKQLVLASDAHPKMIDRLSEKLVSRFVSGMVVKIDSPDLKTRLAICRQKLQKLGQETSDAVLQYVAANLNSNVRELEGALLKLVACARLQNMKITLALAKHVLEEHIARTDPIVHVSDIDSAVATYFGTTPAKMHSPKKDRTVTLARSFSMYLVRKHTEMSFPEIGRHMGGKNHATVLLSCRKIEGYLSDNADIRWQSPTGNRIVKAKTALAKLEESIC